MPDLPDLKNDLFLRAARREPVEGRHDGVVLAMTQVFAGLAHLLHVPERPEKIVPKLECDTKRSRPATQRSHRPFARVCEQPS